VIEKNIKFKNFYKTGAVMNIPFFSKEKQIHNESRDQCSVTHIILKGSNENIGKRLGEIAKNRHKIIFSKTKNKFINNCQKEYLKQNYPIHYKRMTGFSQAYNEKISETEYDFSSFGNKEAEIACSAIYYPPEYTRMGEGILSRNLDFEIIPKSIRENSKLRNPFDFIYVLEIYPDEGYPSLFISCFELFGLALDGINSKGLTVAHLHHDSLNQFGYQPHFEQSVGINEILAVQMLLDNCKNCEEAKKLLMMNKHHSIMVPVHLIIGDSNGNSFIWEYNPINRKEYILDSSNKPRIITNFPLFHYQLETDFPQTNQSNCPYERFLKIKKQIDETEIFDLIKIKKINNSVFCHSYNHHQTDTKILRTIYHNIYNINELSMDISFYKKEKEESQLHTEYYHFQLQI